MNEAIHRCPACKMMLAVELDGLTPLAGVLLTAAAGQAPKLKCPGCGRYMVLMAGSYGPADPYKEGKEQ